MKKCFQVFVLSCLVAFSMQGAEKSMQTIRVATYNILHGGMVNLDFSVIGKDLKALDLDLVGLQEIDQKTSRVKGIDTMRALSEESGFKYYAFSRGIDFGGGQYGTGILSRYPIKKFRVIPLESKGVEARSLGYAILDVHGVEVHFLNTHLSYESKTIRGQQFRQIAELLKKVSNYLLTADFNTDDLSEFRIIPRSRVVNQHQYISCPEDKSAIDNIVYSPEWTLLSSGMQKEKHSDHYLVWAIFSLKNKGNQLN